MRDLKEWSQIGQQLADQGTPLFGPKCNFNLKGANSIMKPNRN